MWPVVMSHVITFIVLIKPTNSVSVPQLQYHHVNLFDQLGQCFQGIHQVSRLNSANPRVSVLALVRFILKIWVKKARFNYRIILLQWSEINPMLILSKQVKFLHSKLFHLLTVTLSTRS